MLAHHLHKFELFILYKRFLLWYNATQRLATLCRCCQSHDTLHLYNTTRGGGTVSWPMVKMLAGEWRRAGQNSGQILNFSHQREESGSQIIFCWWKCFWKVLLKGLPLVCVDLIVEASQMNWLDGTESLEWLNPCRRLIFILMLPGEKV